MAKRTSRQGKDSKRNKKFKIDYLSDDGVVINIKTRSEYPVEATTNNLKKTRIHAQNEAQGQFMSAIKTHTLTT